MGDTCVYFDGDVAREFRITFYQIPTGYSEGVVYVLIPCMGMSLAQFEAIYQLCSLRGPDGWEISVTHINEIIHAYEPCL